MNASTKDRSFSLHFEGRAAAQHTIPAAVLVQILQHTQRTFDLIGLHVEGKGVRERARIPASIVGKFQLVCAIPIHGCYALPVVVGNDEFTLFSAEHASKATRIFQQLMRGVATRDAKIVNSALPDTEIRRRALGSLRGMLPQPGSSWCLDLYDGKESVFARLDSSAQAFLHETLTSTSKTPRETSHVVTGFLTAVDFDARKLTIQYPATNRLLDCYYDESAEDWLYENRRNLIQVTGRMIIDASGDATKIVDVTDINDLDLSPFNVELISHNGLKLRAARAIELNPMLDETYQLLQLEDETLGISVFGQTREQLQTELYEQIAMLWNEYACADEKDLEKNAQRLKNSLLNTFVVSNDS